MLYTTCVLEIVAAGENLISEALCIPPLISEKKKNVTNGFREHVLEFSQPGIHSSIIPGPPGNN